MYIRVEVGRAPDHQGPDHEVNYYRYEESFSLVRLLGLDQDIAFGGIQTQAALINAVSLFSSSPAKKPNKRKYDYRDNAEAKGDSE